MNTFTNSPNFSHLQKRVRVKMLNHSLPVHTERWQGMNIQKKPEAKMHELSNVFISVPLNGEESLTHWQRDIQPNLPWADNHFDERVCGMPINPGVEWANWPWGDAAKRFLKGGVFNHNYMERYWPKYAGKCPTPTKLDVDFFVPEEAEHHMGIRHSYGDLDDIVDLLVKEPLTRQAYLPIFFPEDTGIGDGDRKPCSLGYQFMMRNNELSVFYPMRSCDLMHHFADDIYLTVRLLLWVLQRCRNKDPRTWVSVQPGRFDMYVTSLHLFVNDFLTLKKQVSGLGQLDMPTNKG